MLSVQAIEAAMTAAIDHAAARVLSAPPEDQEGELMFCSQLWYEIIERAADLDEAKRDLICSAFVRQLSDRIHPLLKCAGSA
jgi:hypothetical protein